MFNKCYNNVMVDGKVKEIKAFLVLMIEKCAVEEYSPTEEKMFF